MGVNPARRFAGSEVAAFLQKPDREGQLLELIGTTSFAGPEALHRGGGAF
jgi:hypothetical protein